MSERNLEIREATKDDLPDWARLRLELWPDNTIETLTIEAQESLESKNAVCFFCLDQNGQAQGFIEAAIYHNDEKPYCHVEGWYLRPEYRRKGIGGELMDHVEQWALHRSISILTSDTDEGFPISPKAHAKAGFKTIHTMTIFLKEIDKSTHEES